MDKKNLKILLEEVQNGKINVEQAMDNLKSMPYDDLEFAKIDTHRALRRGFPEVIFCQGKTVEQIQLIVKKMTEYHELVLGMRADESVFEGLKKISANVTYNKYAKAVVIGDIPKPDYKGKILVISAGTADMPVSEEAALTAEAMGNNVERLYDVGIAGIHRILNNRSKLLDASVLIVTAGMEGALPGIVGSIVEIPVIAVPTSVGYGVSFQGLSALLTMLNTCVPGIAVVNIDNGFGAGYMAALINRMSGKIS